MAVTLRQSQAADGNDPTATFGSTPNVGSLLVVVATERSGTGAAGLSISGSGWTKELAVDNELANGSFRCSMAVWWKVAGVAEPTAITITTSGGTQARVVASEWDPDAGETFTLQAEAQRNTGAANDENMETGTTVSTSGEQFIITAVGGRLGDPTPTAAAWTSATSEVESGFGITNGRAVHIGGRVSSVTGTKSDTSNVAEPGRPYVGACAGILVFSTAAGGAQHFGAASLDIAASIGTAAKKTAHAAAAVPLSAAIVTAAKKTAHAASAVPLSLSVSTAAKRRTTGAASLPLTLTVGAVARKNALGASTMPLALAITTAAKKNAHAALDLPLVLTFGTAGTVGGAVTGSASLAITFGSSVSAKKTAQGAAALPLTATVTTAAKKRSHAVATLPLDLTVTTAANKDAHGAAALPLTLTIATSGAVVGALVIVGLTLAATHRRGLALSGAHARNLSLDASVRHGLNLEAEIQ